MKKEAEKLHMKYLRGTLTFEEEEEVCKRFIGIFRPLLEDALSP